MHAAVAAHLSDDGGDGWSDHAVVDHDMDTLHVFTGVEIDAIPARTQKAVTSCLELTNLTLEACFCVFERARGVDPVACAV